MPVRPTKRRWLLPLILGGSVLFLAGASWFVFSDGGLYQGWDLQKRKAEQDREVQRLTEQKEELLAYLNALKAGDELALQRAAREKGLLAPDETVYNVKVDVTK
jgi:cell division protein FtsB